MSRSPLPRGEASAEAEAQAIDGDIACCDCDKGFEAAKPWSAIVYERPLMREGRSAVTSCPWSLAVTPVSSLRRSRAPRSLSSMFTAVDTSRCTVVNIEDDECCCLPAASSRTKQSEFTITGPAKVTIRSPSRKELYSYSPSFRTPSSLGSALQIS